MSRLTKTYSDGTHGASDSLPCGENSYDYKNLLIEKLGEYEDLEEQGRLIKLPCKVGGNIYKPNQITLKEIVEIKIESVFISESDINISGRTTKRKYTFCCNPKDFGKTVFFTKSEAEAKLEELRGGKNE